MASSDTGTGPPHTGLDGWCLRRSLFLVGMMGAGKTTVGRQLARRLGLDFVDADRELEERLGVTIPTIFELEGEEGFRRRESALIEELTERRNLVLATGGGAVLRQSNREVLAARGLVVYLHANLADLWQRLRRDRHRPLLRTEDPRSRIESLIRARDPLYREVAHWVVETGRAPVETVVLDIIGRIPDAVLPGAVPAGSAPDSATGSATVSDSPGPFFGHPSDSPSAQATPVDPPPLDALADRLTQSCGHSSDA